MGGIHHIGVIAGAAIEGVVAGAAIEGVVGGVASEDIGLGVAGAGKGGASEGEVLQVGGEHVVHRAGHRVDAGGSGLHDHIQGGIHNVGIVTGAADQRIDAGPAVKGVVAQTAIEGVTA